jgi:hypothetical protein
LELCEEYVDLLQGNFRERQAVSQEFGWTLNTLEEWMLNRETVPQGDTLFDMLQDTYSKNNVLITNQDRRIDEDPWALILFRDLARELGIRTDTTDELISRVQSLKEKLGYACETGYSIHDLGINIGRMRK